MIFKKEIDVKRILRVALAITIGITGFIFIISTLMYFADSIDAKRVIKYTYIECIRMSIICTLLVGGAIIVMMIIMKLIEKLLKT